MTELVRLQFRPGLVICVGEDGIAVGKYLQGLLQGLDRPLAQGVGILTVDEDGSNQATPLEPGADFPQRMPHLTESLPDSIEHMLEYVQGMLHPQNIEVAGYPIPDSHTQIYIVGHKDSATVGMVMHAVRTLIREQMEENISAPICYLLNALPGARTNAPGVSDANTTSGSNPEPTAMANAEPMGWTGTAAEANPFAGANVGPTPHTSSGSSLTPSDADRLMLAQREVPNFIYIFRRFTESARLASPDEAHYAAAEALFALLATGMTADAAYRERLALRPGLSRFHNHLGSLSTSIVRFPRAEVRAYTSARLGEAVTRNWALGDSAISAGDQSKKADEAVEQVKAINGWLRDSEVRPGDTPNRVQEMGPLRYGLLDRLRNLLRLRGRRQPFLHYRGPTLSVLARRRGRPAPDQTPDHRRGHELFEALRRGSRELYHLFRPEQVPDEAPDDSPWHERALSEFELRGNGAYADWEHLAHEAWLVAGTITRRDISQNIVRMCLSDADRGTAQARAFVEALQSQLNYLAEALVGWRLGHQVHYNSDLDEFERLARGRDQVGTAGGPWVKELDENTLDPGGPPQARPTVGGQPSTAQPGGPTILNAEGVVAPPPAASGGGMPENERFIAQNLALRAGYAEAQIPSFLNVLGGVVLATPPFILLALAFLPLSAVAIPLTLGLVAAGVLAVNAGLGWLFRFLRVTDRNFARKALAAFFARFFAPKAEEREDRMRTLVTSPLRRTVRQAYDALADIQTFFNNVAAGLHNTAEQAEAQLFDGPATTRDVFIANGQVLHQHGQNTLNEIAVQIDVMRNRNYPLQVIRDRLLQELREHEDDLFGLTPDAIQGYVLQVTQRIVDEFLVGSMVELQDALRTPGLFEETLKRARTMLYQPRGGSQDSEIFVIGRDSDRKLVRGRAPSGAVEVQTINPEWFLVAQMFRGGEETALNLEDLLPFAPIQPGTTPPTNGPTGAPDPLLNLGNGTGVPADSPGVDKSAHAGFGGPS